MNCCNSICFLLSDPCLLQTFRYFHLFWCESKDVFFKTFPVFKWFAPKSEWIQCLQMDVFFHSGHSDTLSNLALPKVCCIYPKCLLLSGIRWWLSNSDITEPPWYQSNTFWSFPLRSPSVFVLEVNLLSHRSIGVHVDRYGMMTAPRLPYHSRNFGGILGMFPELLFFNVSLPDDDIWLISWIFDVDNKPFFKFSALN